MLPLCIYQDLRPTHWRNTLRSGINLLSVKTLTRVCALLYSNEMQFNAEEYDTHQRFTALCLYMRVDDEAANASDYMTYHS